MVAAREPDTTEARQALGTLCEAYWYPLYSFLRGRGSSPDEAADLVQGYFLKLIDKGYLGDVEPYTGRFRAFLLASIKNFLANERASARALKRGGGRRPISLDAEEAEGRYQRELVELATPEALYDRRWALTVLDRALTRLEEEQAGVGEDDRFASLKRFLVADEGATYREVAEVLGLSEGAARVAVHRLRRRYGQLVRSEIAETVADPADTEAEVRYLFAALGDPGAG